MLGAGEARACGFAAHGHEQVFAAPEAHRAVRVGDLDLMGAHDPRRAAQDGGPGGLYRGRGGKQQFHPRTNSFG